jgi:hypothetical protein
MIALFPLSAIAQTDKAEEVSDKATDKAEQRLDNKIDKGIDSGLNAVEGLFTKKKKSKTTAPKSGSSEKSESSEGMPSMAGMPGNYGSTVPGERLQPQSGYGEFVGSYTMTVESSKNGKPDKDSPFVMHFHFNKSLMAMKPQLEDEQESLIVYDMGDKFYYMLMEEKGEKSGLKMQMPDMQNFMETEDETTTATGESFERTGKTRTIDGRLCHQYLITAEDANGEAWIDESIKGPFLGGFGNMGAQKNQQMNDSWKHMPARGMMIESIWTDKEENRVSKMTTTNIIEGRVNEDMFDMSNYPITDMSNMPGFNSGYGR